LREHITPFAAETFGRGYGADLQFNEDAVPWVFVFAKLLP